MTTLLCHNCGADAEDGQQCPKCGSFARDTVDTETEAERVTRFLADVDVRKPKCVRRNGRPPRRVECLQDGKVVASFEGAKEAAVFAGVGGYWTIDRAIKLGIPIGDRHWRYAKNP